MGGMTIWLFLASVLAVAMTAWRRKIQSSLVPVRIPVRLAQGEANRSR
jgi:hypothetical protein